MIIFCFLFQIHVCLCFFHSNVIGVIEGVIMRLHPSHRCVLFGRHPAFAFASVCLLWVHVAGLTCWHDEVLTRMFDVNMRSHLSRIATVVCLTFLGEFSAGVLHPEFFPISLLCTGSHHMTHLVIHSQCNVISVFPSHG